MSDGGKRPDLSSLLNTTGDGTGDKLPEGKESANKKYRGLGLSYAKEDEAILLFLNDSFEKSIQHSIEHCLNEDNVGERMSRVIGGYQNYQGAMEFIAGNLSEAYEDWDDHLAHEKNPENAESNKVGNEQDLLKLLNTAGVDLKDYKRGIRSTVEDVRGNLQIIKANRGKFYQAFSDPAPRKLYRKIQGTLKLQEMLLTQIGYFGGSLEYKGGVEGDLEYWVYLMSTKTRAPKQGLLTLAPKPIKPYKTTGKSLLPISNQFSMSKGHAEFTDFRDFPEEEVTRLEKAFAKTVDRERDRAKLEKIAGRALPQMYTLEDVFTPIRGDENKKKQLFTDVMKLSWSQIPYQDHENPFTGKRLDSLVPTDVTDSRLGDDPLSELKTSAIRSHVVGRRANVLVTAETAKQEFQEKISALSLEDRRAIYGDLTVEQICDDAVDAIDAWYDEAYHNHKPIYSGPSGHTLGYLTLYDNRLRKPNHAIVPREYDKPSLEAARLVMLASLIGNKEHHTYDEVMFASVGIGARESEQGLTYRYPGSYGDLLDFAEDQRNGRLGKCVENAIFKAQKEVSVRYGDDKEYGGVVRQWSQQVLSREKGAELSPNTKVKSIEQRCPFSSGGGSSSSIVQQPPQQTTIESNPIVRPLEPERDDVRIDIGETAPLLPVHNEGGANALSDRPAEGLSLGTKILLGVGGLLATGLVGYGIYYLTHR
jgi:hypothetical protein